MKQLMNSFGCHRHLLIRNADIKQERNQTEHFTDYRKHLASHFLRMQRIGRINMEYFRETVLNGMERLFLFFMIVIVLLAKEVANSRENDVVLVSGRACLSIPGEFPNHYIEAVIGVGWVRQKCPPGLVFKYKECGCFATTRNDSSDPQKRYLPSPKTNFKSYFEKHPAHSTPSSLLAKIITHNNNFDSSTSLSSNPEKLSTTPLTASSVINPTTLGNEHVNEPIAPSSGFSRQEESKSPNADIPLDGIQAETSTSKTKDFDTNPIMTGNMKLSLSDLVSSLDQKSKTDSQGKNASTSRTLLTTIKPLSFTASQTPEQPGLWKESGHPKGQKASTINIMSKVLKKARNHQDGGRRTTTRQHPKIVLDYSSVTVSEPFGVFNLSKDIPSYLPGEKWLKSRLPVIETERSVLNTTNKLWFSRDDLPWLLSRFIGSANRKPKLRVGVVKTVETDANNKTTKVEIVF